MSAAGGSYLTLETAGLLATTSTLARKRAKKGRVFCISVPPVPPAIQEQILAQIQEKDPTMSPERHHLKVLSARLVDQQERVALLQDERLPQLQKGRARALADAQESRNSHKTQQRLKRVPDKLRQEYQSQKRKRAAEWKHIIEEECRKEVQAKAKEEQEDKGENSQEGCAEEGEVTAMEAEAEEPSSHSVKQELEECQQKLHQLNESRSEMIWLLKQVIKAEEKRKITKPNTDARIQSSKQA